MSRKPWWVTVESGELAALRRRLLRTVHARFGQSLGAEVEDAVHHAFVALFRNRTSISSDNDGLYRYLVVAAQRAALDRVRTAGLRSRRRREGLPQRNATHSPLMEILLREKKGQIRKFFGELDELDRLIVWRHVVDGRTIHAVAREFGVGWHRADETISRVLRELRRLLVD